MDAPAVHVQAFTHRGLVREVNEDSIAVGNWIEAGVMASARASLHHLNEPFGVLVCDGMGGHNAGEIASGIATRLLAGALSDQPDVAALRGALRSANRAMFQGAAAEVGRRAMGTTVAGLQFSADGILCFNVGDSRVFRFRNGFLRQLSVDHVGPGGGLVQALGGAASYLDIDPHVVAEPLNSGWRYLVCSDGLTDMVSIEVIEAALAEEQGIAVSRLFEAAMAAGGRDNISMILASVEG